VGVKAVAGRADYKKLIDDLNELRDTDKVLRSVLSTMQVVISDRIFERGEDANGGSIGSYSTKKTSISKKRQSRNTGHSYFAKGYKQYKEEVGLDSSKVTLVDSGQMRDDWSVIRVDDKSYKLGFKNELNSLKAEGNQTRFNKEIFAQSAQEDRILDETFQVELDRIFGK
jgi:hypothetical protein